MFGKLFSVAVDGNVFAQPLYAANVEFKGGPARDVLYVATEKNNVYAIDANSGEQIWSRNLGAPVPALDITAFGRGPLQMGNSWDYKDLYPDIGITSTPVIDIRSATIFVVAKTKEGMSPGAEYHYRLRAIDMRTGADAQATVEIEGSVPGSAIDAKDHRIVFNPFLQLNRPGLLLLDGKVYVAFGSHGDAGPFHGWIFAYNSSAINQPPIIFCSTPDRDGEQAPDDPRETIEWNRGGIWQSGTGLAADEEGAIYLATGDGAWDGERNFGNSFLKLNERLEVIDWFTPWNYADLDSQDLDVGSTGAVLLPGRVVIGGGKEGKLYVIHRDHLGHVSETRQAQDAEIVQQIQVTTPPSNPTPACASCYHHLHGAPVFWPASDGLRIYIWPEMESLKSYKLGRGKFVPDGESHISAPMPMPGMETSMPGGMLALSSDGDKTGSALIWSSMPLHHNANRQNVPGVLRAFDASNLVNELWDSEMDPSDQLGYFAKFCPPTIANGRVYMATFAPETGYPAAVQTGAAHIVVYGLFGKSGRKPPVEYQTLVKPQK
jgi:outer membrane protein assembly factor BamB